MDDMTRAIAHGLDPAAALNRELLRMAVMRSIVCPRSGVVLDVRTAVLFTVTTPSGQAGAEVVDGAAWDAIADEVRASCTMKHITLEVIDGRVIDGRTSDTHADGA